MDQDEDIITLEVRINGRLCAATFIENGGGHISEMLCAFERILVAKSFVIDGKCVDLVDRE